MLFCLIFKKEILDPAPWPQEGKTAEEIATYFGMYIVPNTVISKGSGATCKQLKKPRHRNVLKPSSAVPHSVGAGMSIGVQGVMSMTTRPVNCLYSPHWIAWGASTMTAYELY